MIALIAGPTSDTATRDAFLEEDAACVVIDPGDELVAAAELVARAGAMIVAPATPELASFARRLAIATGLRAAGAELPLDRRAQQAALSGNGAGSIAAGELGPLRVQAVTRVSVDLVSVAGQHVNAGIYIHRVDRIADSAVLRHRLTLAPDDPAATVAFKFARGCLAAFGVRDGATAIELEIRPDGVRLIEALPAPRVPATPADAAFRAFGHSHQHLYAESLLRPREFERRVVLPLTPGVTTLATALLRPTGSTRPGKARAGLRVLRRLTGFHGVSSIARPELAGGVAICATFVHRDRVSVANSLAILHELEDSGALFAPEVELFGLAAQAG